MNNKKIFTKLFIGGASITLFLSLLSILIPSQLGQIMAMIQGYLSITMGWLIMILPVLFLSILLFLGLHPKFRHIKFGGKDAKPDYSIFSWLAMLFTSSIGVGIIYFAVNEPLYAYFLAPNGINSVEEAEAVKNAFAISIYHWGPQSWSIMGMAGLVVGYFTLNHKTKYLPSSALTYTFSKREWSKPIGYFMNTLALVCAAMTISVTMGMGSAQLITGTGFITGKEIEWIGAPFLALAILYIISVFTSILPTGKGMRIIGDINVFIAIGILIFAFTVGPTRLAMETIVSSIGGYLEIIVTKNFEFFQFAEDPSYVYGWDVATLQWWLSWTPFMGVFIASISKGRTFKEFALGILLAPTAFMVIWIGTFGGIAMDDIINGGGTIGNNALTNADYTFFSILEALPLSQVTIPVTVILLVLFLATTITSASLSLSRMTDEEGLVVTPIRTFIWCTLMAGIAVAAIVAARIGGDEGLNAIRAFATTLSFPYIFLFLITVAAFIKQLRIDFRKDK